MQKVCDFLKKCKTFYLATADESQPRVRPFGVCEIIENRLYFSTSGTKPVFKQMLNNPRIEICAYDQKDEWLRICAKAVPDSREALKERMLKQNPHLKEIYQSAGDNVMLFYLDDACAVFESFDGKTETIKF